MKKDIPILKVEKMAIAISPREASDTQDLLWDVYLINFKKDTIKGVLVNSKGYGELEGEKRETTNFRFFFEEIYGESAVLIEAIQKKMFEMTNEYWISFSYNGYLYDKKYVFVKGSISEEHFTQVPIIDRQGVMIR